MAVSRQALLGEEVDSGRYAPSVHPLTQERTLPEGVCPEPPPSSEVGHFRLTQMGHFRLTLTARKKYNARLKQKNEAIILGQIGPIRTKMDDITRSIVTSLSGSSFKNRELVEASLIVLSDYHRRCWRGDLVRRLEDHIDPDRIKPQLYLFSRIHSELEKSGKLDGYFFADSGFLYRPTAAWHIGCGSR